jgi:hypothetical protein
MKIFDYLHDAEIVGLRMDRPRASFTCELLMPDGQRIDLRMSGVTGLRCTDFGLQNVVLDVSGSVLWPADAELLRTEIAWILHGHERQVTGPDNAVEQALARVISGAQHCIAFIPSWGARIGVLADRVDEVAPAGMDGVG